MVNVSFTGNLARHLTLTETSVPKGTLTAVLTDLFNVYPELKSYVLDEQGQLRAHVMLALDQQLVQGDIAPWLNRSGFNRLHIMQALSGG